jgi:hypothetical protein
LQEVIGRTREAASSRASESARLAEIRNLLDKIEELRTGILRLEIALDSLERTIVSIESIVYER